MRVIVYIMAFLIGFLPLALAGWDTTLFDGSGDQWHYGLERSRMSTTGVLERATVAGSSTNITPRRFRGSTTLKEGKDRIDDALSARDWVDTNERTNGTFNVWFESNATYPDLNNSNILVNVGAQTNWFDDHPRWRVSTVSNGWMFVDDVLNEMTLIEGEWFYVGVEVTVETGDTDFSDIGGWYKNSWDDAKAFAEDYYIKTTNTYLSPFADSDTEFAAYTKSFYFGGDTNKYSADAFSQRMKVVVTNEHPYDVELSMYARHREEFYIDQLEPYTTGLTSNYTEIVSVVIPANGVATSAWFGTLWDTGADINWCRSVTPDDDGDDFIEGYDTDGQPNKWLLDFGVTNGFEMVEE